MSYKKLKKKISKKAEKYIEEMNEDIIRLKNMYYRKFLQDNNEDPGCFGYYYEEEEEEIIRNLFQLEREDIIRKKIGFI